MKFALDQVPFSRRGSFLSLNRLTPTRAAELGKAPGLFLRTCRGNVAMSDREIFRLESLRADGPRTFATERATPLTLTLEDELGQVEIVFVDARRLRLRGRGSVLRLSAPTGPYDYARAAGRDHWELNFFSRRLQLMLHRLSGDIDVHAPWEEHRALEIEMVIRPEGATGSWEIELQEFHGAVPAAEAVVPFDTLIGRVRQEWEQWLERTPATPGIPAAARALAAYVQWSALVAPEGHLHREAMLMSKNWMVNVWSWDHCFNAIALAHHQPDLAWDQWAILFDHQHASGMLPDCINDRDVVWNFTKPPVHGWALREMLAVSPRLLRERARLDQATRWLERWTMWWLAQRDDDGDGVPQYNHGNDSGWDNATVFGAGMPIESPDLATFLIVQMDVIVDLHRQRRQPAAAARWRKRADALTQALLKHSWRGDHFASPRSGDHATAEGDSLVAFMPLLLGDRLPADVRDALRRGVLRRGRFMTAHGAATESPGSPLYRADGYWRGPIWAPSTHLIVAGLIQAGARDAADQLSRRFCRTVARSGCAENFDALSGAGLRDRAYTWTASVFLHLCARRTPA